MKNNRMALASSQNARDLQGRAHQALTEIADGMQAGLQGKWLPTVLLSLYYLIQWSPPFTFIPNLVFRWYIILALGILLFVLQKAPLVAKASKLFWIVYGLSFLGAVLSLIRAPSPDTALWNTVALVINFVALILFLPTFACRSTRGILLIMITSGAVLWTFVIQQLVAKYGTLAYSTFAETGENKNSIAYGLALSATALFYLAIFWKPAGVKRSWQMMVIRLALGSLGLYFLFCQALIYARGSIIATFIGLGAVLVVVLLKSTNRLTALLRIAFFLTLVAMFVFVVLPAILEISPYWNVLYWRAINEGMGSVINNRDLLLMKGVYLIAENPFLGVGLGGSRLAISSNGYEFPNYLVHNTFLTNWAEKGILGLLSDVVWISAYIYILGKKFFDLHMVDQIWLIIFIPFIVQMNFKNLSSETMLLVLAGIYYEQYFIDKAKTTPALAKR